MTATLSRWLSLRAYGVVTSTLFRATTPPRAMRLRFERFAVTSRATMCARHPGLAYSDHAVGPLAMERVHRTRAAPSSFCTGART